MISGGAIVGIVVGSIFAFIFGFGCLVEIWRKCTQEQAITIISDIPLLRDQSNIWE